MILWLVSIYLTFGLMVLIVMTGGGEVTLLGSLGAIILWPIYFVFAAMWCFGIWMDSLKEKLR